MDIHQYPHIHTNGHAVTCAHENTQSYIYRKFIHTKNPKAHVAIKPKGNISITEIIF